MSLPSQSDLYGQAMSQVQGWGNAEMAALQQSYQNALGGLGQSLASTGLSGTSVGPSMRMGFMKQYQLALNDLSDKFSQQKLGAQSTFGLGGIQSEQAQQGLDISRQNLGISQQHADLDKLQYGLAAQDQNWKQNFQQTGYNNQQSQLQNQPQNQSWNSGSYMSPYLANMMQRGPANTFGY